MAQEGMRDNNRANQAARWLLHLGVGTVIWLVLTRGDPGSWLVGAPFVVVAAWIAVRLGGIHGAMARPLQVAGFMAWFVWTSMLAGASVARRALAPSLPLAPGTISYQTYLPDGVREIFACCITLLPGTLTANLQDDRILVHVLDLEADNQSDLRLLERRLAKVFGLQRESCP